MQCDVFALHLLIHPLTHSPTHLLTQVRFMQCDVFALHPTTTSLPWRSSSPSDAVMLAGVLASNDVLTAITMSPGGELNESDREEIGRALLANKHGKVGSCDLFGLTLTLTLALTLTLRSASATSLA